jgi:hypothetical protein
MARTRKKSSSTRGSRIARLTAVRDWFREHVASRGQVTARFVCWFVLLAAVVVGGAAALTALQRYAEGAQFVGGPVKYTVQLESTPAWMPATLCRYVLEDATPRNLSFDDPSLCRAVHDQAAQSPWIEKITEIRRVRQSATRGVVTVRAQYRQPVARVAREGRVYYVDAEGVVLPYSQTPKFASKDANGVKYFIQREGVPANFTPIRIHYIAIEGVEAPPPTVGDKWSGADLAQGLRLVKLLSTRPYANQISVVDVRNHERRISESEPELWVFSDEGRVLL